MKSLRFESKSLSRFHKENSSFKFNSCYAIQKILRKILNKIVHYFLLPHFPPFWKLSVCVCVCVCSLWRHYKQPSDGIRLHIFFTVFDPFEGIPSSGWPSFARSITLELVNGGIFVIHRKYRLIPVNEQTNNVSKLPATEWITNHPQRARFLVRVIFQRETKLHIIYIYISSLLLNECWKIINFVAYSSILILSKNYFYHFQCSYSLNSTI